MGFIEERKCSDGKVSYRCEIRRKGHPHIHQTFSDRETAELFIFYKERLIEEMRAFEVPISKMLTLQEGYEIKKKVSMNKEAHPKYMSDMEADLNAIFEFVDPSTLMESINFNMLEEWVTKMLRTTVFKGGQKAREGKERTGHERSISPATIRRRLATLSTIFNCVNEQAQAGIQNPVLSYMPHFRATYLKGDRKDGE